MGASRPELIRDIAGLRERIAAARKAGATIGFVPTMGALHAGHGALMDAARRECNFTAVSIFVNPIQFNNKEDYEKYGRNLPTDLDFCAAHQVDVVFAPSPEEMYPVEQDAFVEVLKVSKGLCGDFRPGHFRGVATVVTKLFNIVQPDIS
ncbi:MAG TPA: pantoate--beta-alanine ligase, partial [Bryobacteraceae bacterium]